MCDRLCSLVVRVPGYKSRSRGFDSRHYQIFREVVGLERDPLSLVITIDELLEKESIGSCPENRKYGLGDPSRWPRGTLCPQKLALSSPTSGGRSADIVRSRTQATKFSLVYVYSSTDLLFCWVNTRLNSFHNLLCFNLSNIAEVFHGITWGRKQIQFPKRCVF
jgi:hypothetical protein